jgi:PAS domain-containing protein
VRVSRSDSYLLKAQFRAGKPGTNYNKSVSHGDEKFRRLLEAAPDAMVIVDGSGRMLLVNSQTESMFGYTREELLDRPVEILIPESLRQ